MASDLDPSQESPFSSPLVARAARLGIIAWALIGVAILAFWTYRFVVYPVRIIFPPLIVAIVITYLLGPLINRLEGKGISRGWGTLLTYVVFLSVVGVGLAILVPIVSSQVRQFASGIPTLIQNAESNIEGFARHFGFQFRLQDLFSEIQANQSSALSFFGRITSFTAGVLHVALIFILGPVIAFYLLMDFPKLRAGMSATIPQKRREEWQPVAGQLSTAVGGYVRGQLLVALFVGLASMLALYIIGLPYWAPIGLIAGLFNLVPLIGPFIGAIPAVFVAFTTTQPDSGVLIHPSPGWPLAIAAVIALTIVQQIDNHIISPNVVARTVKMHPVTVMLSLLAGGTLLGLWGMIFAVPTVASIKIVLMHVWDTRTSWPPDEPEPAPVLADGGNGDGARAIAGDAPGPGRLGRIRARLPGKR